MRCISCRQPYASLIVHGIKPVENRDWKFVPQQKPQWLAIHASLKEEPGCALTLSELLNVREYSVGAIIGAAFWEASYDFKTCPKEIKKSEFFNPLSNVYLVLVNPVKIKPVEAKGMLGLWDAPQEAVKRINKEIKRCGYV